jgi:hypothetical protein
MRFRGSTRGDVITCELKSPRPRADKFALDKCRQIFSVKDICIVFNVSANLYIRGANLYIVIQIPKFICDRRVSHVARRFLFLILLSINRR